jgi:hypothetical protein
MVAVNVSPRHLTGGALLEHVAEALQVSGLPAERLELEIPEPALLDADLDVLFTLAALRDLGIGIAFDNFGAGYASLGVLRKLPLTAVNLDRALIRSVPADREDAAIVRALVETGHALGLKVAAAGIEAGRQRDFLHSLGCDEGQGHLFSQALASEALRARLQRKGRGISWHSPILAIATGRCYAKANPRRGSRPPREQWETRMSLLALVPDRVRPACAATEAPGRPPGGARGLPIMAGVSAGGHDPGRPIRYDRRRVQPGSPSMARVWHPGFPALCRATAPLWSLT